MRWAALGIRGFKGWTPSIRVASWWTIGLGVTILMLAAALRVVGIDFGSGAELHPDESMVTRVALQQISRPGEPLKFWAYPPALANLIALPLRVASRCASDSACVHLVARGTTLVLSLLSCVAVGLAAFRMRGQVAGLFGFASAAFSPLWVEHSRYSTPDAPTAFGTALTSVCVAQLLKSGALSWYLLAGAGVGIAAAFKYLGALCGVLVLAAHVFGPARSSLRGWLGLMGSGVAALVVFLILNPQVVGQHQQMLAALRGEFAHYSQTGHSGYSAGFIAPHVLRYMLLYGVGIGASLAAVAGLTTLLKAPEERSKVVPFLVTILIWVVFLATRTAFFARNIVHVLPLCHVLAGVGFAALLQHGRLGPKLAWPTAGLLAIPLWQSTSAALTLSREDTRIEAALWMRDNIPADTRIIGVPDAGGAYMPVAAVHGRDVIDARGYPRLPQPSLQSLYLVVSYGRVSRFLRSPDEFPEQVRSFNAWHASLERFATPVRTFEQPARPGGDLFGATVDIYHHPRIEIWRVQ